MRTLIPRLKPGENEKLNLQEALKCEKLKLVGPLASIS